MCAIHKKKLGFPLRALCAMPIVLLAIPSAYALWGESCGKPGFKWVGSNGGDGAEHGEEGVRVWLEAAPGKAVWTADDFYRLESVNLDWDPTAGLLLRNSAGSFDISVGLVGEHGTFDQQLVTSGSQWETIQCLRDNGNGVVYCGEFGPESESSYSLDFDPTDGVDLHTTQTRPWTGDAFVTVLLTASDVMEYEWTVTFGGLSYDAAIAVVHAADGYVVAGIFYETADLDPGPDSKWHTSNGRSDIFLMKLSIAGVLQWVHSFGGGSDDDPYIVQVDSQGNGYVLGVFNGAVDFDPGPGEDWFTADRNDIFLSKYTADGVYVWTRVFEPNLTPTGYGLSIDGNDRLLIDGFFEESMDVDPGPGEHWLTARGEINGLLLMLNSDGEYLWNRQIGGPGRAVVAAATFDRDGHVIAAGHFKDEVDFNDAGPPDVHVSRGGRDAFLSRFTPDGEYEWTIPWGGLGVESSARQVVAHENGDLTVSGLFQGTVDFDPGEGVHELTAVGARDMYLLRLGCADECAQLRKHRAKGGAGQVKSKVVADAALGRVTVECTGASGPHRRRADLDAQGRSKVRLKRLAPGEYECAVTKLETADGATVCEGEFLTRTVTVE